LLLLAVSPTEKPARNKAPERFVHNSCLSRGHAEREHGGTMKRKHLRFGKGFRVAIGNARSQAAEMVIAPGDAEGGPRNRHRGADQWLFVVAGTGRARVNGRRYALRPGSLLLIEHADEHEIAATGDEPLRTLNLYVPPGYTKRGEELPAAKP
jgi:mannose-6-phosphate isomerase-like protein (cupin superfamily)